MNAETQALLTDVKALEERLKTQLHATTRKLGYELREGRVVFEKNVRRVHAAAAQSLRKFLWESPLLSIITAPVIYAMIVPAVILDFSISIYQAICFRAYRVPRVRRRDYFVIDRHLLGYLNAIQKVNCVYCSYFNGLMAYASEIAGRTEQYWCPIKHARAAAKHHARYPHFFDYGDAEGFAQGLAEIRKRYEDCDGTEAQVDVDHAPLAVASKPAGV